MAKKIKLELTEAQFYSLIDVIDTISAQIGCSTGEFEIVDTFDTFDSVSTKNVKLLDRMLKKNGYKRKNN